MTAGKQGDVLPNQAAALPPMVRGTAAERGFRWQMIAEDPENLSLGSIHILFASDSLMH